MRLAFLLLSRCLSLVNGARLNRNNEISRISNAPPLVHSCICSTALGHAVELECSISCSVETCHRSENTSTDIVFDWGFDWKPLQEGRGTCCLSSSSAIRDGCPLEATLITESGAKSILADALQQAERNDSRNAFVVEGSEHLLPGMSESFETAKEKIMNTSRSGAQFFFSGNYRFILKSIHPPEYDVLQQLAAPTSSSKSQLAEHMDSFQQLDETLRVVGNCVGVSIQPAQRGSDVTGRIEEDPTQRAAHKLAGSLSSFAWDRVWHFIPERAEQWGTPVYIEETGNFVAFWCKPISGWRVHSRADTPRWVVHPQKVVQCDKYEDSLHLWLKEQAEDLQLPPSAVDVVYRDFTLAFQEGKISTERPIGSGTVTSRCTQSHWPATLINDFVVAFRYQASSSWMVVRNSVVVVEDSLKQHGFTKFFKENDVFDVKPLPIISDQRSRLFGMHFARCFMNSWRNWLSVRSNLKVDVDFMNAALGNPMVDYSLLVSAFYVDDTRMVLDYVRLPNCVEQPLSELNRKPYGDTQGSILVCFAVIDMLMEFTFEKVPENTILFNKWSNWGDKVMTMFDCLGQYLSKGCEKYKAYLPKYLGVDLPIASAKYVDITDYLSGDGRVVVPSMAHKNETVEKKCCCLDTQSSNRVGWCTLVLTINPTSYLFRNKLGCGALLAGSNYLKQSSYHSYWRHAKRCFVNREDALEVMSMPAG